MKAVIVGASAGLGRALAEALARRGDDLLLVASDARDLDALASSLRLNFEVRVELAACRLAPESAWLEEVRQAAQRFGDVDVLMLPIGLSRQDDTGALAPPVVRQIFEANLLGVMDVVGVFLPGMMRRNCGCIVGFGSIAAARGRSQNVAYSAAKRGLASYFESLRHLLSGTGVAVQFFALGYMRSQQSYGKRMLLPAVTARHVAETVIAGLGRGSRFAHMPRFWGLVALMLRAMPWVLFKRLKV